MERDLNLIRNILLAIEKSDKSYAESEVILALDKEQKVLYHLSLLREQNYIKILGAFHRLLSLKWVFRGSVELTNDGYEFLSTIKDNKIFQRIKKVFKEKSISFGLYMVKAYGLYLLNEKLGIK
ncbi:MAG: DUF2513 domain-containing protein [Ignavibacteria bacterium]|jgi:hypothetical protein